MRWPWVSRARAQSVIAEREYALWQAANALERVQGELRNLLVGGYGHTYPTGEPALVVNRPGYEHLVEVSDEVVFPALKRTYEQLGVLMLPAGDPDPPSPGGLPAPELGILLRQEWDVRRYPNTGKRTV